MKRFLLLHYGEVGIKQSNRPYFVKKLKKRLAKVLAEVLDEPPVVKLTLQRFLVELPDGFDEGAVVKALERVFGIKNYGFAYRGGDVVSALGREILNVLEGVGRPESFCVRVKRSQKMEFNSEELERALGAEILRGGFQSKVDLNNPELTVYVEFFNGHGFFFLKKYEASAGLPTQTTGKAISLISAGIDSPVASYRMMQRGLKLIFLHFHAYPFSDQAELENAKELVEKLSIYQGGARFYTVGLGKIQKSIATNLKVPGRYRTILFRRLMLKIAERFAKKHLAKALVTGDSLGQVASQTLENIYAIHEVTRIPLFQPLIGYGKEEIIQVAKEIGTYEISIRPCKESCGLFAPRQVEVKASLKKILELEAYYPLDEYVDRAVSEAECLEF